jgi:hypothetical protein
MENTGTVKNSYFKITHLPTFILLIGYPVYWIELFFIKKHDGGTSALAWVMFLLSVIFLTKIEINLFTDFAKWIRIELDKINASSRIYIAISSVILFGVIIVAFKASLLPPHLSQEFDALNYHITVPRQHLILGSFKFIPWSSADLFILPIDFSLAPYWLSTELPNKFPQFLFLIGLVSVTADLVKRFSGNNFIGMVLAASAVFGSHFIGIQMGTAMLDIVIAYLFLAAVDSFLSGNILMASAEFAFFFWSKPFMPLQITFLFAVMAFIFIVIGRTGLANTRWCFFGQGIGLPELRGYAKTLKKALVPGILVSILIAGPFVIKSAYHSGTPLYPFAPRILGFGDIGLRNSLADSSRAHMSAKDAYGYGRSVLDFGKHLWLIAVPDKGVNNRYDYPIGLNYLIFLGPFLYLLYAALRKKEFPILPLVSVAYWLLWWFGSQQSRFLYVPVLLMLIAVVSEVRLHTKVFMAAVFLSLVITGLAVLRANKNDFGLRSDEVLRQKDKRLVEMSRDYLASGRSDIVSLDYYDVAYACFPVKVTAGEIAWVLKRE